MAVAQTNDDDIASIQSPERFRTVEEIARHPRFDAACDLFVDEMLGLYGEDRRLIRGLIEVIRAVSFMVIISLDASCETTAPATYPTLANLLAALQKMGITNRRRILDLVNGMQQDGLITREPVPSDKRARILRPTEKMLALDRDWLAAHHASLAFLYPEERAYRLAVDLDPIYQNAYRRVSIHSFDVGNSILGSNPAVSYFLSREVGYRILMVLLKAVRGSASYRTPGGFYTAAASQSGVSRNHVRSVLKGAADLGLVELSTPPGLYVEVLEPLRESMKRWVAVNLSGIDQVSRRAMTLLDATSQSI